MSHNSIVGFLALGALLSGAAAARAADATAGQAVFKSQCAICHQVTAGRNGVGPSLFGIVGRKTGSVEGFSYSAANKAANITWDAPTLDKYLVSPKATIPATKMAYPGLKDDAKRADLVAYLATLH
jgi:cytochrome c